jgi:hypothetical protein
MPNIRSLILPDAPIASKSIFIGGLPAFLNGTGPDGGPSGFIQAFAGSPPDIPNAADVPSGGSGATAQQVFVLTLDDAAINSGTVSPAAAGWRFLSNVPGKLENAVLGRVIPDSTPPGWKLTAVYYGDRVKEALATSLHISGQPLSPQGNDYELRVLSVPGLNLEAFWLEAQTQGTEDVLIPFPAGPNQLITALRNKDEFTLPEFLAAIRPLAARLLKMGPGRGA